MSGQSAVLRPGRTQTLYISTTSTASAPVSPGITTVRLCSLGPMTASLGNPGVPAVVMGPQTVYLEPGIPEYFRVSPGCVISGIRSVGGTTLYITEMGR